MTVLQGTASDAQKENSFLLRKVLDLEGTLGKEQQENEEQVISLLKAVGLYDPAKYDPKNRNAVHSKGVSWAEHCRKQLDEERIRILTLKHVLMKFSGKLTRDDNQALLRAGIILVAGL
jgi:hypothetical protein